MRFLIAMRTASFFEINRFEAEAGLRIIATFEDENGRKSTEKMTVEQARVAQDMWLRSTPFPVHVGD